MMKTKRLTESAMLIALAVVLELVGRMVIPPMPFGGQLTLCAMLPIVLISYRHGGSTVRRRAWAGSRPGPPAPAQWPGL